MVDLAGRRTGFVLVVVAMAVAVLAGCSDDGRERVDADRSSPVQAVAAATARLEKDSGRIRMRMTSKAFGTVAVEGVFDGSDYRLSPVSFTPPGGSGDPETGDGFGGETIVVDGRQYTHVPSGSRGKTWVSSPLPDRPGATLSPSGIARMLGSIAGVSEAGAAQVDGTSTTRYEGTVSLADFTAATGSAGMSGPDVAGSPEDVARQKRLEAMVGAAMKIRVQLWVDPSGRVRKVEVETSKLPASLETCEYLSVFRDVVGGMHQVIEFTDLGSRVHITAPDPATVMSSDDLSTPSLDPPPTSVPPGPTLNTSDGSWTRSDLEEWVADDADLIGLDPATVHGLSDEELVARYEQTLAASDAPTDDPSADDGASDEFAGCPT